jgi:hypothetical protein
VQVTVTTSGRDASYVTFLVNTILIRSAGLRYSNYLQASPRLHLGIDNEMNNGSPICRRHDLDGRLIVQRAGVRRGRTAISYALGRGATLVAASVAHSSGKNFATVPPGQRIDQRRKRAAS